MIQSATAKSDYGSVPDGVQLFGQAGRPRLAGQLKPAENAAQKKVRKVAEQFVATAFFEPMLKQMRDSPFKDERLAGGRGGQAFSSLLDQRLAEHAAHGQGGSLVDSFVRKFSKPEGLAELRELAQKAKGVDRGEPKPDTTEPSAMVDLKA